MSPITSVCLIIGTAHYIVQTLCPTLQQLLECFKNIGATTPEKNYVNPRRLVPGVVPPMPILNDNLPVRARPPRLMPSRRLNVLKRWLRRRLDPHGVRNRNAHGDQRLPLYDDLAIPAAHPAVAVASAAARRLGALGAAGARDRGLDIHSDDFDLVMLDDRRRRWRRRRRRRRGWQLDWLGLRNWHRHGHRHGPRWRKCTGWWRTRGRSWWWDYGCGTRTYGSACIVRFFEVQDFLVVLLLAWGCVDGGHGVSLWSCLECTIKKDSGTRKMETGMRG
ncbi:uncharacterized protein BCR38DRAFT_437359 [Pseudomassariella vexata]|uniref:Uncharacterized protein n=1 Tax=Pseudomassariella vexata TaxID=1141098 RepID=A0A1Y2DS15_9PEZI|nr:uncharacterized protein BCR38DRAFT_437359 [Pseudomassariella vexata]ORY62072.1 hypothetical protein BCR38DRAFT_437359 [Pseudomassariella vexata]